MAVARRDAPAFGFPAQLQPARRRQRGREFGGLRFANPPYEFCRLQGALRARVSGSGATQGRMWAKVSSRASFAVAVS